MELNALNSHLAKEKNSREKKKDSNKQKTRPIEDNSTWCNNHNESNWIAPWKVTFAWIPCGSWICVFVQKARWQDSPPPYTHTHTPPLIHACSSQGRCHLCYPRPPGGTSLSATAHAALPYAAVSPHTAMPSIGGGLNIQLNPKSRWFSTFSSSHKARIYWWTLCNQPMDQVLCELLVDALNRMQH